jgi:hypothetical protein
LLIVTFGIAERRPPALTACRLTFERLDRERY